MLGWLILPKILIIIIKNPLKISIKIKKIKKTTMKLTYLLDGSTELDLPFKHCLHTLELLLGGNVFFLLVY